MLRRVSEAVRQSRRHETPLSCVLLGLDALVSTREKLGGEAAEALLKAAGYKGEEIHILANKRVHVPSYDVAVLAQAMMAAVGIKATIVCS